MILSPSGGGVGLRMRGTVYAHLLKRANTSLKQRPFLDANGHENVYFILGLTQVRMPF